MSKIRKSAKGEECQVRIPMACNGNPETTVLAHLNGGGMGMKQPDYLAAYCCSACHDVIDGRTKMNRNFGNVTQYHYEGIFRTQKILFEKGLLNEA